MKDKTLLKVLNLGFFYKIYSHFSKYIFELLLFKLKKLHNQFWAFRNISFEVEKGQFFCLLGGKGSGKTTLLKVLAAELKTNEGEVLQKGKMLSLIHPERNFNQTLSGRENSRKILLPLNLPEGVMKQKMESIEKFSELGEFFDLPLHYYSSAMRVHLFFSVFAFLDFDILLMDDILAVTDEYFRLKSFQYLHDLCAEKKAVILISNDLICIRKYSNSVIVLHEGRILFQGEADHAVRVYLQATDSRFYRFAGSPDGPLTAGQEMINMSQLELLWDEKRVSPENKKWPEEKFFSRPFKNESHVNMLLELNKFVFCDEKNIPRFAYQQGEKIFFYGELLIRETIRVPYIQLEIYDQDKRLVHGKNSLQLGAIHPLNVQTGDILRFYQGISLGLAAGAYTISFSVFDISLDAYERLTQIPLELGRTRKRLLMIDPIAALAVYLAGEPGPKRLHEGICDLPGDCWFGIIKSEASR